jgi:A/G-specific adenine glycosylase
VLARITGDTTPIDSTEGKKRFGALANEWLDQNQPGKYNQAMMDFGAVVCKPRAPLCQHCPFAEVCVAKKMGLIDALPVKGKKIKPRKRWFYYIILQHGGSIAIRKRVEKDIWQNLYEFPLVESEKKEAAQSIIRQVKERKWVIETPVSTLLSDAFRQQLSHQTIEGRFITLVLEKKPRHAHDWQWVQKETISRYPFPGFINQFLRTENSLGIPG